MFWKQDFYRDKHEFPRFNLFLSGTKSILQGTSDRFNFVLMDLDPDESLAQHPDASNRP